MKNLSTDELRAELQKRIEKSKAFLENNYTAKWDLCDKLYKGILAVGESVPEWRSKLFVNLTFGIVNSDTKGSIKALYAPNNFVSVIPAKDSSDEKAIMSAKVMEKVMLAQERAIGLYRELYDIVMDSVIKGIGVAYLGWQWKKEEKEYIDGVNGKIVPIKEEHKLLLPQIESVAPEDFIIDPDAKDLDTALYAGHRYTENVSCLKDNLYYNRQDEVSACLSTLEGQETIDVYLINEKKHIYAITATGHIIKDHMTTWKHNMLPYAVCVKYPLQRSIYGLSTVEMFADIQDWTNTLVNETIDNMRLALQKMFIMSSSSDLTRQLRARPGLILKVRDMAEIKEFPISPVNQDVYRNLEQMEMFTNRILGNLDSLDASSVGTATEAKLVFQRAQGVYEVFANYNRDNFFKRIIKIWIELNQQFLKDKDAIKDMLSEKDIKKFKIEPANIDFNASFDFRVTGDKGLDDKVTRIEKIQSFNESLTQMGQLPPEIDRVKYIKKLVELYEIGDDILAETGETPEDDKIMEQINAQAQSQGMTSEQYIIQLAQERGVDPASIIDEIRATGDFEKYLAGANTAVKEAGADLNAVKIQ